jgi:hypothetical protein
MSGFYLAGSKIIGGAMMMIRFHVRLRKLKKPLETIFLQSKELFQKTGLKQC